MCFQKKLPVAVVIGTTVDVAVVVVVSATVDTISGVEGAVTTSG